jgi:hypothetical protein
MTDDARLLTAFFEIGNECVCRVCRLAIERVIKMYSRPI